MTTKKYYTAAGMTVAMRTIDGDGDTLNWLLSDHLGSTSITANADGTLLAKVKYTAFGEILESTGTTPTDYLYTGQLNDSYINLYWYSSRWYDSQLAHFTQPDSIIPNADSTNSFDRYSYSENNPIRYNDPTGHIALLATALIGAVIGAGVDYAFQVIDNVSAGQNIDQALTNVNVAEIVGSAVAGGITGFTLGVGTAALASTGIVAEMAGAALFGGLGSAVGGQVGALAEAGVQQIDNTQFNQDEFITDALEAGFLNADDFIWDCGTGAILSAAGTALPKLEKPSIIESYRFHTEVQTYTGEIVRIPVFYELSMYDSATSGVLSGFAQNVSDVGQEIVSQGIDRYRRPQPQ